MSTPLREVIEIPEQTGAEDYVLKLTESVGRERVAETLREYVVTPDLGPAVTLQLDPGPGLTLVTGRNGSGKSSFAEAAEFVLTGDNLR